ncbi:poly(ADP-ribose) glycohydrolase 1-like isoform X1 [Solanum lycopersicum]|uniref:poly(ADP-ribose) glycohydrolase 1-like isoform X1 n=1 Tax=Solanum lycopersicum TaxID=4081 RepID=UPI0002BCA4B3|nr:poly(ADP-ribose) glycohydrolase 1-like isoform X1 [Solanum lycopersicum]
MENREDLKSILPFLPFSLRSSSLFWPAPVTEALTDISKGPNHSKIDSGEGLFIAISDIRNSLSFHSFSIDTSASQGFALFFDDLLPRDEAAKWFEEVVPQLAKLLLRLPLLLETHYENADDGVLKGVKTGLRLLESQEPGIVFLSQELIGALLACALFCLFPTSHRGAKHLPMINFDHLFACLHDHYEEAFDNKLKCIVHYFGRICSSMPAGYVSFERKVLSLQFSPSCIPYPKEKLWSQSNISLCHYEISVSGLIEDQSREAIEVDFANMYLGGGALVRGCVQEEIRFMINPELIAGMLFLPCMADNEAIEIVGTERFSSYTGYASSFRFNGDYVDKKDIDVLGRRKTRIVAIDALCCPGNNQYRLEGLLREINKAFCGFMDQCKCHQYQQLFKDDQTVNSTGGRSIVNLLSLGHTSTSSQATEGASGNHLARNHKGHRCPPLDSQQEIGVVTGNWGCGAFGGDPQLKAMLQWIAASQAMRPFILYYTFGLEALQMLEQVIQWIVSHKWTAGELWNVLVEYSSQRLREETRVGFFNWLLPSLSSHDDMLNDSYDDRTCSCC